MDIKGYERTADENETPQTISGLLLSVSARVNSLRDEASRLLQEHSDTEGYREKREEIGRVVLGLPGLLVDFEERGGEVPADVGEMADYLSEEAETRLATKNGLGLGTILVTNFNASFDDPDCLQELAAKYQPSADV